MVMNQAGWYGIGIWQLCLLKHYNLVAKLDQLGKHLWDTYLGSKKNHTSW